MSRLLALLAVMAGTGVLAAAYLLGQHPDVTHPDTPAHTARIVLATAITLPTCAAVIWQQHRTRKDQDR